MISETVLTINIGIAKIYSSDILKRNQHSSQGDFSKAYASTKVWTCLFFGDEWKKIVLWKKHIKQIGFWTVKYGDDDVYKTRETDNVWKVIVWWFSHESTYSKCRSFLSEKTDLFVNSTVVNMWNLLEKRS